MAKVRTDFHFNPIGALEMDILLFGRHLIASPVLI